MAANNQHPRPAPAPPRPAPASPGEGDESYDETVAETFPASDPPASTGITGPRRRKDQLEKSKAKSSS
jgi:hypothetical protein